MTFGEQVVEARKRSGLRQQDLAVRAGVSRPTVSHIERGGSSRWRVIIAIADVLGLPLDVRFLKR